MKLNTMDETVNDFLKEINEIAPTNSNLHNKDKENNWQECFDETSGFPYYWNIKTDQVTWEMPLEYKDSLDKKPITKSGTLFARPPVPDDVKIYKISNENSKIVKRGQPNLNETINKKSVENLKTLPKQANDLQDEKVILISSYGSGTESDEDDNASKYKKLSYKNLNKLNSRNDNNFAIKTNQKEQKKYDDQLVDIKEVIDININKTKSDNVSVLSLVAGYGGESDDDQEEKVEEAQNRLNTTHSPLFPIIEPVDITQFANKTEKQNTISNLQELEVIDLKAFQRKRRIDVQLINVSKKPNKYKETSIINDTEEIKTDGDNTKVANSTVKYPGFTSGGVLFTNQEHNDLEEQDLEFQNSKVTDDNKITDPKINSRTIEIIKDSLKEKLNFLNEGKEPTSAIQTMLIQVETLYDAFTSGSLVAAYLEKWLENMSSELIKLEQEATPNGWLLQWDRSQKRYFYCNKETGQTQWDYPESDLNNCSDDAMDISTTPPPPEDINCRIPCTPPPPPRVDKVVTPPPPIISFNSCDKGSIESKQPLPPGTNSNEPSSKPQTEKNDSMTSVLDSFYSDIAAIESTVNEITETTKSLQNIESKTPVTSVKKKKSKVKLSQGLAMKKKGVSKLVEKWKNVQKNYD